MFCQLYQDALTEYTYAAELAGLTYNIQNTIYGLAVRHLFVRLFYGFFVIVLIIIIIGMFVTVDIIVTDIINGFLLLLNPS